MTFKKLENQQDYNKRLEEQALAYLRKKNTLTVKKLYDELRIRRPSITEAEVTDLVWRLVDGGKANFEELAPATDSLWKYILLWERNLWFYTSVAVSLFTVLAIYILPSQFPIMMIRLILGSVFVLFIPGYVTVKALFPKGRELNKIESSLLSVGLSLSLVPVITFLLNYTHWGITLNSVILSLTIFTLGLSFVSLWRCFRIIANLS